MSYRNLFFDALRNDGALNALGIDTDSLYPGQAPSSPEERMFAVMRWGAAGLGVGPVRHINLTLWVYNREPNYGPIDLALQRARVVLPGKVLSPIPAGGYVLGVEWQESSEDLTAPEYGADVVVRNESYRITASGI